MSTVYWRSFRLKLKMVRVWETQILEGFENQYIGTPRLRCIMLKHPYMRHQYIGTSHLRCVMLKNRYRWGQVRTGERGRCIFQNYLCAWFWMTLTPALRQLRARTRNNVNLNCFPIFASCCCNIPEVKNTSGIRHDLSVRRPCVWYLSTYEDIRQKTCMIVRTIAYIYRE